MLIRQGRKHLGSATATSRSDPEGSAALLYDAARKALAAVLANQGLRATAAGGHLATYEAVHAQLVPPLGAVINPLTVYAGSAIRPSTRQPTSRRRLWKPPISSRTSPRPVTLSRPVLASSIRCRCTENGSADGFVGRFG